MDLSGREWVYMTPLVVLSLWIGCYPKPFMAFIERPVNAVVRQVRPTYPIPGLALGQVDVQPAPGTTTAKPLPITIQQQPNITVQPSR